MTVKRLLIGACAVALTSGSLVLAAPASADCPNGTVQSRFPPGVCTSGPAGGQAPPGDRPPRQRDHQHPAQPDPPHDERHPPLQPVAFGHVLGDGAERRLSAGVSCRAQRIDALVQSGFQIAQVAGRQHDADPPPWIPASNAAAARSAFTE